MVQAACMVAAMRRMTIAVLIAGLVAVPVAAAADPFPGTPQFAVSKRGTAVVVPTYAPGQMVFTPFVGKRGFTVFARMPATVKPLRLTRVLMKYKPAAKRCAPTFRLDKGKAIGLRAGAPDAKGYVAFSSAAVDWTSRGHVRFCVWLTPRPLLRVRPIGQVITFMKDGLGVVQYPARGSSDVGVVTDIASTVPLHLTQQRLNCPKPSTTERDLVPQGVPDFQVFASFDYRASCPTMTSVATVSSAITGTLTVSMDVSQSVAGEVRATGSGLCMLSNVEMSESDARALLDRQGCRVGTTRAVAKHSVIGSRNVWTHTVNGAPASLVATGTTVDLVVEP